MSMPTTPTLLKLPLICNSAILARHAPGARGAGETGVNFILLGTGTTADYQYLDREGRRTFVLKWDARVEGHVLRVPLSLWCADGHRLAYDLMDQRRTSHSCVITLEGAGGEGAGNDAGAALAPCCSSSSADSSSSSPVGEAARASAADSFADSVSLSSSQTGAPQMEEAARIVVGPREAPPAGAPTGGRAVARARRGAGARAAGA